MGSTSIKKLTINHTKNDVNIHKNQSKQNRAKYTKKSKRQHLKSIKVYIKTHKTSDNNTDVIHKHVCQKEPHKECQIIPAN